MSALQPQRQFAVAPSSDPEAKPTNFAGIQSGIGQILQRHIDPVTGALAVQNSQAVTYLMHTNPNLNKPFTTADGGPGYGVYRDHPALVDVISYIEDAGDVITTQNGRSALATVMTLLPANSHIIVAPDNVYPGTRYLFDTLAKTANLGITYTESTPEALEKAFKPGQTKMIFSEPVTNPLMKVADLDAIAFFAQRHSLLNVADNTTTMLLSQPAKQADISFGSLTKCFAGSNNVQGGYIAFNKARGDLADQLRFNRNYATGAHLADKPAELLVERSTDFARRMETHSRNAQIVAEFLAEHPLVARVRSPWLPGDPGHGLARRQFGAAAAILTFELKGDARDTQNFAEYFDQQAAQNIERRNERPARPDPDQCGIVIADSFGGAPTSLVISARQTRAYAGLSADELKPFDITPGTVRVAVGRGDPEQITRDLDRGLNAMRARRNQPVPFIKPT